MADKKQFGNPRAPQFGGRISPGPESRDPSHCGQCESMLADALDGALSPADQAIFDAHMALCGPCSDMLADARRGAAWLEMLRDPRPEPPAALLERILAQTSGAQTSGVHTAVAQTSGAQTATALTNPSAPQPAPSLAGDTLPAAPLPSNVLPFRTRAASAFRANVFGHAMLQPRLAMTAAMAFFSIALTLNLTGVRVSALRPADLKPSSIKRGFYSANARVVQYYEGLRVVYELESRVHDFETETDTTGSRNSATPAAPRQSAPDPQPQPRQDTAPPPRRSPGPGSSRREDLNRTARMVAVVYHPRLRSTASSARPVREGSPA